MVDNEKLEILHELQKKIEEMPKVERTKILGGMFTRIISVLTRRLIKLEGYSVTSTILERELRELGQRDAQLISNIFGIKSKDPENTSKVLKIAALILGYNLDVEGKETVVRECPFAILAKEMNEPQLCNICSNYCQGIVDEMLGKNFIIEGFHDIQSESPKCYYVLKK
jgi:predicted ArsR family transcriptional regulator